MTVRLKNNRILKLVFFGIFFALILSLAGIGLLRYGFEPHHEFERNSFAYFLLLDSEIANIPAAKSAVDVRFSTFPQDGTAPAVNSALIRDDDLRIALRESEAYFQKLGYEKSSVCEPRCLDRLVKNNASISIDLNAVKNELTVTKSEFLESVKEPLIN